MRHRSPGSLLDDAVLEAPTALLTVAVDAAAADEPAPAPAAIAAHGHHAELDDADMAVCATESAERSTGVSLATARMVAGGGRGVGGPGISETRDGAAVTLSARMGGGTH